MRTFRVETDDEIWDIEAARFAVEGDWIVFVVREVEVAWIRKGRVIAVIAK